MPLTFCIFSPCIHLIHPEDTPISVDFPVQKTRLTGDIWVVAGFTDDLGTSNSGIFQNVDLSPFMGREISLWVVTDI